MDEAETTAAYGGTWYATTKVDAPLRPPLHLDLDVDICVIGGGLAGLTTARELARDGRSVVLIEAGRIAAAASGRSTGFVLPGFAAAPESIVSRVGFERAKDLWSLSQSGLEYVRNAIRDEAMPGVAVQDGWLHVSKTDNGDASTRLVGLIGEFGGEVEGWPAERVRTVLHSERYFHALHFPQAFHIHPLNYALGLAAAAERAGARIFEQSPALSIDPAGVRKRIVTPAARLRAHHVVLCGNVQVATLLPKIASALVPITTYVITTAPLGPGLAEAISYHGAVSDSELADNHYRVVDGDRLMWSGRVTMRPRDPNRYRRALSADIKKTYPQLGEIAVDYAWSGTLGNSIHRMPQIGELAPGMWLASGFGGHGLNTTAMAGTLIARAIADGDQTWRQFTPFELVWAGGILGRATAQIYYWMRWARDAMAERRSRAAELARRRARDVEMAAARQRSAADSASIVPTSPDIQRRTDADLTGPAVSASRPRRRKRRLGANG
ncbi:MAG: NAD(P)/FAD-dependent oxidoreductase [Xanthobacteraceae bacterium]